MLGEGLRTMFVSDALRTIITQRGLTQAKMAEKLGVSQPAISSVLSVGNPQARILASMLGILGYKLVAVPEDIKLPEEAIVLEVRPNSK